MSKKIVLSEMAYYDIDSIFSYISQDSRQAAEKLRVLIYEGIRKLSDFPEIGSVIPEEDAPGAQRGLYSLSMTN
ncbi:MAG: type II toxin-antitoxin system RelE/ParE family toxin [Desulfitobacteriaceae bacterium]